jgi:hypothetical protein
VVPADQESMLRSIREENWNGEPVIRVSVCSWVTTAADVDRSVAAFVEARREALSKVNLDQQQQDVATDFSAMPLSQPMSIA